MNKEASQRDKTLSVCLAVCANLLNKEIKNNLEDNIKVTGWKIQSSISIKWKQPVAWLV